MSNRPNSCRRASAFTVLEILVVALIVGILASMTFPMYGIMRAKAEDVSCTANLKTLHVSLAAYLADKREWPQAPESIMNKEEKLWEFFVEELEEYGGEQKYWTCPTHFRQTIGARPVEERPEYFSSYIPTLFDDREATPFKWRQPWLIERGDLHGNGAKLLMSDGDVSAYKEPRYN